MAAVVDVNVRPVPLKAGVMMKDVGVTLHPVAAAILTALPTVVDSVVKL